MSSLAQSGHYVFDTPIFWTALRLRIDASLVRRTVRSASANPELVTATTEVPIAAPDEQSSRKAFFRELTLLGGY